MKNNESVCAKRHLQFLNLSRSMEKPRYHNLINSIECKHTTYCDVITLAKKDCISLVFLKNEDRKYIHAKTKMYSSNCYLLMYNTTIN